MAATRSTTFRCLAIAAKAFPLVMKDGTIYKSAVCSEKRRHIGHGTRVYENRYSSMDA
jgi:hypothetical protein